VTAPLRGGADGAEPVERPAPDARIPGDADPSVAEGLLAAVPLEASPRPPVLASNRLLGAGVALIASMLFAVLLASGGAVLIGVARPGDGTRAWIDAYLGSPVLAVPTLLFLLAFLVHVSIANRAGWWAHILGGLVVAATVYLGSIGVLLLLQGVLQMSAQGAFGAAVQLAVNPALVLAALLARELVLWLGLGISRSGARSERRYREALARFEQARIDGVPQQHIAVGHESVDGSGERTASFDGAPRGG